MNSLQCLGFENNLVRLVVENGQVAFCLSDVLRAIESTTNVGDAKDSIVDVFGSDTAITRSIKDTMGRDQVMIFVYEEGVTFLLSRSRTEMGKLMNRWVHKEVLPTIRKTGGYSLEVQVPQLPQKDQIEILTNAISAYNQTPDGYLKRLFGDVIADKLSVQQNTKQLTAADPIKKYTIVKVRAKELGYSLEQIGDGKGLGMYVAKRVKEAFKERVGRYDVKHYEINLELDNCIHAYFSSKGIKPVLRLITTA